jgi:5-methylcytosine-specific restriction endonuclease McrA
MRERRAANKAWAKELLGGKCVFCGDTERLEFDHIDEHDKTMVVADMLAHGRERLRVELQKCRLLCYECHKARTLIQIGPATHGSLGMYSHHRCRCDKCRTAWNANKVRYSLVV